ncbi:hypothetical protein M501DRAFT_941859 [Patellaria atrata CBS 101060]|uniref:Uncharacterized protein n=1 Tax=Patellaria atrata CBS 101060 TaxID=1346257 RepID=A0A9P4VPG6_9PEZI|nr:hypothetical protein M501DRAFT_941859 [Patellaria atrata CBS 101060]
MTINRASSLRSCANEFCQSLLSPPPPEEIISKYFSSHPRITEHGPEWARKSLPFLHKTFKGKQGCEEYFQLLSETLKMHMGPDTFPETTGFIVDPDAKVQNESQSKGIVSVIGKARFESIKTGKSWDEEFIYRLSDFDENGKIGHWEIWADPLSAWAAVNDISDR